MHVALGNTGLLLGFSCRVSLQLDLFAKNLLIEEFPSSKEFIKPHKGDDNIWYFDTNIYQVEGLARFYIGLANHIKILKAPELEKFIASFVKENLQAKDSDMKVK